MQSDYRKIISPLVSITWLIFWGILGTKLNDFQHLKNIFFLFEDSHTYILNYIRENIIILVFLLFLIISFKLKKISNYSLLLFYPISSFIGFYISGEIQNENHTFAINFLISISSIVLYINFFINNKLLKIEHSIFIFKISLIILFVYFLLIMLPIIIFNLSTYATNMRGFDHKNLVLFDSLIIQLPQNSNGASRILVIFYILIILRFKKNILKNKNYKKYFFLSVLIATLIYFYQSKLNNLFIYILTPYIIFNISKINLKKKIIFVSTLIIIPIFIYNINAFNKNSGKIIMDDNVKINLELFVDSTIEKNLNSLDGSIYQIAFKKFIKNNIIVLSRQVILEEYLKKNNIELNKDTINKLKASIQNIKDNINSEMNAEMAVNLERYLKKQSSGTLNNLITSLKKNRIINLDITKNSVNKVGDNINLLKEYKLNLASKDIKDINYRIECFLNDTFFDKASSGRLCGWILIVIKMKPKNLFFGNGFFADQKMLRKYEKLASNSFMFVFYNAGLLGTFGFISFFIILFKKINNIHAANKELRYNFYFQFSIYILSYIMFRAVLEDSLAFLTIDLLILVNCLLYIEKKSDSLKTIDSRN